MWRSSRCAWPWLVLLAAAQPSVAAPHFVEAGAAAGIEPYTMAPGMGGGLAAADFDDDGDIDVFVPTAEGLPDQLYRNLTTEGGPGLFEEIAAAVGVASLERARTALWLDADGDRRLDLLVAGDCFHIDCVAGTSLLRLYRQEDDGTFVDVTAASGLFHDAADDRFWRHRGGMSAGDLDNDGDPDLFTTSWQGGTRLFRNQGDGTFVDISESSGAGDPPAFGVGPWQGIFHDFDGDRRQDIFVAVDFAPDRLLMQQTDGTFVDQAPAAGLDRAWNGMGVALGDVDNDGDFDLYVTNISDEFDDGWRHSTFYLDDSSGGTLQFSEVSAAAGVDDVGWGWGVTFFDADHDTLVDLAATNGFSTHVDPSRFFFNEGREPAALRDASAEVGFDDSEWGSGLVAFDVDGDGDLDMMQTCSDGPLRLLLNEGVDEDRHYLVVRPRREGRFSRPLGAVVQVEVGGTKMIRLITAGTSFLAQEPAEAHFGLGSAATVDRVEVRWPGGGVTVLEDVAADQVLTVTDLIFEDGFDSGDLSGWSTATGSSP